MRFHLLPPPHLVPLLLTSVLAFAGGTFALMRTRARSRRGGECTHSAFEDYRAATLSSLEAEAEDFRKYLDALKRSRDKADFEAFLDSRKGAGGGAH